MLEERRVLSVSVEVASRPQPQFEFADGDSFVTYSAASADGRYVAFTSNAANLVEGIEIEASESLFNVYRFDRLTGIVALVSINITGTGGGNATSVSPTISANGNVVAFRSGATNLSDGHGNARYDVFVRDIEAGETYLASPNSDGALDGDCFNPMISADGNVVSFVSTSTHLHPLKTSANRDVFAWNRETQAVYLVSVNESGTAGGNDSSYNSGLSADGNVVVFKSESSNLHPFDSNQSTDVFARDLSTGTTHLVSVSSSGASSGDARSENATVSADGNRIAFVSAATNIHPLDTVNWPDVYVRDLSTNTTLLATVDMFGTAASNAEVSHVVISSDGTKVAFESTARNLHPLDTELTEVGNNWDVYVRDVENDVTHLVSVNMSGTAGGNGDGNYSPSISEDGSVVAFTSGSSDLHPLDTDNDWDIYARNIATGVTELVSVNVPRTASGDEHSQWPSVSADGYTVAFYSDASDLFLNDVNQSTDVFLASVSWELPQMPGDYNLDSRVDAADYSVWRDALGATGLVPYNGADGDGDGTIDQDDYAVWKANFGRTLAPEVEGQEADSATLTQASSIPQSDSKEDSPESTLSNLPSDSFVERDHAVIAEPSSHLQQLQSLQYAGPDLSGGFGDAIAADGNWVAVAAPYEDNVAEDAGAVYMFERVNGQWESRDILRAPAGKAFDQFGCSVAISGTLLVVGAQYDDEVAPGAGAAYVYTLVEGHWLQIEKLMGDASEDAFGCAVAVENQTIVIGAHWHDSSRSQLAGAAYVYEFVDGSLRRVFTLTDIPDIRTESFWIGNSVAISGNRIAVGAPGHRLNVGPMGGAVVMLERHEGEWQYKELVVMPDGAEGDRFGEAIALRENTLVVGAPEKNYSESIREAGAAYVFHFDAYQWQFERKFTSMYPTGGGFFGRDVGIVANDVYVLGWEMDPDDHDHYLGNVDTYRWTTDDSWSHENRLTETSFRDPKHFRASTGANVDTLFLATLTASPDHVMQDVTVIGVAHTPVAQLLGDYNNVGGVDAADYSTWRDSLGATGLVPYSGADGDGDGTVDQDDYAVWKANFGRTLEAGSVELGAGSAEPDGGSAVAQSIVLHGEVEERTAGQASSGTQMFGRMRRIGPLISGENGLGTRRSKAPADLEAGNSAEAGGRVRVAVESRDLALLAWRAGLGRRGDERGLRVRDWELDRGGDAEDVAFEDVDAAIELLADGVPALITR
jgi:hypothetical protein